MLNNSVCHGIVDNPIARFVGDSIIVVGEEKRIIFANGSARKLFGLSDEMDVAAADCCDVLRMNICEHGCPTLRISKERSVVYDYFVRRKGSEAVYCVTTSLLNNATGSRIGIIHSIKSMDMLGKIIEEQKRTQEKLRLSQLKMHAILEAIADGVFTVDGEGRISHFNRSMEKITGFAEEEVAGKDCQAVLHGSLCGSDCPIVWSFRENDQAEKCSEVIMAKDGRAVPVFITAYPLRNDDDIIGVVCSVQDRTEVENLRRELGEKMVFPEIVGRSNGMLKLFELIESVSRMDVTVLIEGETGTGKELVARAIHGRSHRSRGAFVAVNCSVLSPFLLESELFGHTKGSFTGAIRDKKGKFEVAEGGTLFLDEISEISKDIQVKLLRFLQEREIERVGETVPQKVDVRIIAATNRNLKEMVRNGSFRKDLYYRLNVIPVKVPPLRERKEDIPSLVEHFLKKHAKLNQHVEGVSTRAFKNFIEYQWPGNVRELENAVVYARASCQGKRIERANLPPDIRRITAEEDSEEISRSSESSDLTSIEKKRIVQALADRNWKMGETAKYLGFSRNTLWRRMKRLGMKRPNR